MSKLSKVIISLLGTCIFAGLTGSAGAQAIQLKLADRFPPDHYIAKYAIEYWIEQVKQRTGGTVAVRRFGGESLGKSKDMISLIQAGVTEIGEAVPGYVGDQLELSTVTELPSVTSTACQAAYAYQDLANPDGFLGKRELAPKGLRLLFTVGLPAYHLFLSKKVDNLEGLKGFKIRATGAPAEAMLRQLGMVPVRMGFADLYESWSRGTVDGTPTLTASIFAYDMQSFAKYILAEGTFGSAVSAFLISIKTWNALPANVQQVMMEVSKETTKRACEMIDNDDKESLKKLQDQGSAILSLSPQDEIKLKELADPVKQEWTKALNGKNKPGTETLKLYQEAATKYR